ncbi:restriction endonuclease [Aliarcobacter butzleri]|uniref:restriction endonuclease n=1 Tax=Aliarcobacter butzleri TaxID=28197 RepID=UPI0028763D0E|nr:restriction endonuclease [Aliarcobacter butzleri]MDS1315731.1 restriction endonuclease [Aliarcobacter butzleri]
MPNKLDEEFKNPFRKNSKNWKFFNMCDFDAKTGYSKIVELEELEDAGLMMGNGGDWCRDDGNLAKYFNINRIKQKGKIISVQLTGYKKNSFSNKISYDIKKHYESYNCVVLGVGSDIQIDHKDGRKDDYGMPETQSINDFQPMHRNANTAKRQHCKVCKETNIRFDAKILGYKVSQWIGLKEYTGNCIGCYWFDPLEFNKRVSSSYIKER